MIKDLVEKCMNQIRSFPDGGEEAIRTLPATPLDRGVPTLQANVYRPFTLQLRERYELFGRWENATHGHWLGLNDMEAVWKESSGDDFLDRIRSQRIAGEKGWPNEASALFRPERLSLFACSDITNEKIYLLWLDFEDEPECWVYDSNGESRYKDLSEYLTAYIADDLSASERRWKLAEAERLSR